MIYPISIENRIISHPFRDDVIQNGIESDYIDPTFDDEWGDMASVRAVFTNGDACVSKIININSNIEIPWEVLEKKGRLFVTFVGYQGDKRIVTRIMDRPFKVAPSGRISGSSSQEPTLDEAAQILQLVNQALDDAEQAVDDATTAKNAANAAAGSANSAAGSANRAASAATSATTRANTAADNALAAAANIQQLIAESLDSIANGALIEQNEAIIDTLAKNVCTDGLFIDGVWYVKSKSVSYSDGVLTVNGSSKVLETMRLPSSRCSADDALETAERADDVSSEALRIANRNSVLISSLTSALADLASAIDVLARNSGSYPFFIDGVMYVRDVTYSNGVLNIPSASYSNGRMNISAM